MLLSKNQKTLAYKERVVEACSITWTGRWRMESTHLGGCHCGLVRFEVAGDLSRTLVCNCSTCTKKGFLHLIVPPDRFRLVSGKDTLATYRFNTGVAKHLSCTASGARRSTCRAQTQTRSTSTSAVWTASSSEICARPCLTAGIGNTRTNGLKDRSKRFFFEKKEAKTFCSRCRECFRKLGDSGSKSFLVFFSKKNCLLSFP